MRCIVICGPTGSGKSSLAINIASKVKSIIINADSQQVFREFPILTDQPADTKNIQHKLYGCVSCGENFSSYRWCLEASTEIKSCLANGYVPILVGGTGFYIRNLLDGHGQAPKIDNMYSLSNLEMLSILHQNKSGLNLNLNDAYRINRYFSVLTETGKSVETWNSEEKIYFLNGIKYFKILLLPPKDKLELKCKQRIEEMFPHVVEEVKNNYNLENASKIIGFSEIKAYLEGKINLAQCKDQMLIRTRQYAKRQSTWFRNQMKFDIVINDLNSQNKNKLLEHR